MKARPDGKLPSALFAGHLMGLLAWLLVWPVVGREGEAAEDVGGQPVAQPPEHRRLSVLIDQSGYDRVCRGISPLPIFARVAMLQDLLDLVSGHR